MAPTIEPPKPPPTNVTELGTLPTGLSGQLVGIGPDLATGHGVVHTIELHDNGISGYRSQFIRTDAVARRLGIEPAPGPRGAGPDIVADGIITFGGSILALGNGTLAYELTSDLATLRRVDLAGQCRTLAASPKQDPVTGELHVLATAPDGAQAHVVVSAGALTRRSRPITRAPNRVTDLAITGERAVYIAGRFVGIAARESETAITWIVTGTQAPLLVSARDAGESLVVFAVTPALERWTLHLATGAIHRDVLDPTPTRFARLAHDPGGVPQFVWSTGIGTVARHHLDTARSARHCFRAGCTPSEFTFVTDPARTANADGGWLIGFVHHPADSETDLVVLDAADLARPPIATIHIPRHIHHHVPGGLHSTWIASTHQ